MADQLTLGLDVCIHTYYTHGDDTLRVRVQGVVLGRHGGGEPELRAVRAYICMPCISDKSIDPALHRRASSTRTVAIASDPAESTPLLDGRLTPDRQSKKGALWSHKPLRVDQVTATLKFRIHGQVGMCVCICIYVYMCMYICMVCRLVGWTRRARVWADSGGIHAPYR